MDIHLVINDEELIKMMKRLAVAKFGYLKGSFSLAAEEAFREWIMKNLQYTHTKSEHKFSGRTGKTLIKILNRFNQMWDGQGGQVEITLGLLRKIIQSHAGYDNRTINKYIKILTEMWVIEPVRPGYFLLDLDRLKEVLEA